MTAIGDKCADIRLKIRLRARQRLIPTLWGCLHMARYPVRLMRFVLKEGRLPRFCYVGEVVSPGIDIGAGCVESVTLDGVEYSPSKVFSADELLGQIGVYGKQIRGLLRYSLLNGTVRIELHAPTP